MALPKTAPTDESELDTSRSTPERRCAVTGECRPVANLVRFACSPIGIVTPDISEKLPGRGVWISADRVSLEKAVKTKAFSRGFKSGVETPSNLTDLVEKLLVDRCQSILGFARKGGDLIIGSDQVRAELQRRRPAWLIEASDGAEDGRKRVYALAKALYENVNLAGCLSAQEFGMALGRDHVVHGLLKQGHFASVWAVAYGRLRGFRDPPESRWFSNGDGM